MVQGTTEFYSAVSKPGPCQLVMALAAAMYKLRKLSFVTHMAAAEGWLFPVTLAIVVLEVFPPQFLAF